MQEALDLIIHQIRGAWRFRRYALIAAWIVAPLGWIAIFALPDVYQANSSVSVDTKTALKPALQDLVLEQDVTGQLNLVRQSLLSGPQLAPVAQEIGLIDTRSMPPQQQQRILNEIRDRVVISVTPASGKQEEQERDAGSIYSIQYQDVSRERAIKLVQVLQNNLIEKTLFGKRSGSENAQKFLETQIREYESRLRQAEDKLAAFKTSNVGLMPTEQGGYFPRLQLEMEAVTAAQSQLAIATSRRDELQRQLRGEAPIAGGGAGVVGAPGSTGAAAGGGGDTLSRIRETQARIDDLLLRFTDKHPDVVAQRETLEALKQRRDAEVAALRRGDPDAVAASGATRSPVYQSIQLALNQTEVEIASLRRQISDRQGKVAELRKMMGTMPQVEAQFAQLNRDYDVTRTNYTALVGRLEKSRLGEEAATSGPRPFVVINPPNAEFKPISPKRSILVLAALVVAIAFGAGVAFLMHQLKPVFNSARGLTEATGLQVLGAISMIWVDEARANEKRSYVRYGIAVLALFLVGAVVLQMSRMGVRFASQPGA